MKANVLVLGTADWNQPIATNQHYVSLALSSVASVTFVESIGLRKPTLAMRDMRRMWRRLRPKVAVQSSARPVPNSMQVVSPHVVPLHNGATASMNRRLLMRAVRSWVDVEGFKVLWCYSPVTYGLEQLADASVYHCVDLLGEVPGISSRLIWNAERNLSARGARAIGSSENVINHLREIGFSEVTQWPNVADSDSFSRAVGIGVRRRAAVFAGNLTETKVDFDLLEEIARAGWELHIAGPISEGGGNARARVDGLVAAGAQYHGMLSIEELARLFAVCSVGLIPYVSNRYTAGVSPLKTYEYLAAGLSVVSAGVPSVDPIPSDVFVAQSSRDFLDILDSQSVPDSSAQGRRLAIAHTNSWERRSDQVRELLHSLESSA